MQGLIMIGADLSDASFTLEISGLPEICWNSTRIERDAFNGRFGPPQETRFDQLYDGGEGFDPWKHLDRGKVQRLIRDAQVRVLRPDWERGGKELGIYVQKIYSVIDIPATGISFVVNDTKYLVPVDGNHRMMARLVMGLPTFSRFVVPIELEGEYRVSFLEVS